MEQQINHVMSDAEKIEALRHVTDMAERHGVAGGALRDGVRRRAAREDGHTGHHRGNPEHSRPRRRYPHACRGLEARSLDPIRTL